MSRRSVRILLPAAILLAAALPGAWPMLRAADLSTGAGDWPAQVYRIAHLRGHGLASWTHDWAGGLPLWSAYQPIPHLVTAAGAAVTGVSNARAMTAALALVMLALPLSMYGALRLLRLATLPALSGALLALVLDSRRQSAANFTELWGLTLTPLLIALAIRDSSHRGRLWAALVSGLAIYLHPLAAITGLISIVAAAALALPRHPSARQCIAAAATLGRDLAVWAGAAAFFLLPAFHSARPAYEEPYLSSASFERLLARLQAASFAPAWPLWLGLAAHGAAWLAWRGPRPLRRAAAVILVVAGAVALVTLVSLVGWGPRLFLNMQLPRLLSLLPLLAAATAALLLAALPASGGRWAWAIPVVLLVLVVLTGGPNLPASAGDTNSEVTAWLRRRTPPSAAVEGRLFATPEQVAVLSAIAPERAWYTSSYSGREWSILGPPLTTFMQGAGRPDTRAAYLTALGVTAALVPAGTRPALTHPVSGTPVEWQVLAATPEGDILGLPWRAPVAAVLPAAPLGDLRYPDSHFMNLVSSYVRDELTHRFAGLWLSDAAVPAGVRAPSAERLVVTAPPHPAGVLVIGVNWDTSWRASIAGRSLAVHRAGPNMPAIDLPASSRAEEIVLEHRTPWTWPVGALVVLLTAAGCSGPWLRAAVEKLRRKWAARSDRVT